MEGQHMNKKQYREAMQKKQHEQFLKENPAVKEFYDGLNARFKAVPVSRGNVEGFETKVVANCDDCSSEVTPTTFSIFMTPEKPHRCLLLCINCIEKKAREYNIDLGKSKLN